MPEITITRPDDWHLHLRDGVALVHTVNATARVFRRAIVMPNLQPPITSSAQALAYRQRILAAVDSRVALADFQPLMTLYLTDHTAAAEIAFALQSGCIHAIKLYPAGATTNSEAGVTAIAKTYPVLSEMERLGMPLLVHGEITDSSVDIFDREKAFIDAILIPLMRDFPELRIVFEHITTAEAATFVAEGPARLAATITPHHLLYNRNDMLVGGIRPHYYCLPVLKRNRHQEALLSVIANGSPRFFLGTDSAPHSRADKECAQGCAGIFNAHAAIELYAEAFESRGALDKLEAFASFNGPDFYGLPRNLDRILLQRESWRVANTQAMGDAELIPLRAGEMVRWRIAEAHG